MNHATHFFTGLCNETIHLAAHQELGGPLIQSWGNLYLSCRNSLPQSTKRWVSILAQAYWVF